jgi:ABC-2 type transport system permease protein
MPSMNSRSLIAVIAAREFITRIRTRTFAITTVLIVAAVAGYILLQALVFNPQPTSLTVGFAGAAQGIASPVRAEAASLGVTVTVQAIASAAEGQADVRDGTLDALVSGPPTATTVTVQTDVDATLQTVLNDVVSLDVLNELLTQHGIAPTAIDNALTSTSVRVDALSPIDPARVPEIVIGLLVAGTLYISLMVYGQIVAAGVVEEKSNRIVEILLTAVRPWQLMMGKITGIGLVALVQIAGVAAVALVLGTATKLVSIPTLGVDVVVSGVVWFVLGYLMYALLFAGAGSMVSRQEDVASVSVPVILVIVASWIIALTVAAPYPGSTATTIFSMIPLMSPVIMPVRIAAGVVPLWQIVLSVTLVIATIYVLAAVAGRIYRNSVLRVGGRVKLGDALGLAASEAHEV